MAYIQCSDRLDSNANPPMTVRDDSVFTAADKLRVALDHVRSHHRSYQWCIAAMTLVGVHRVTGAAASKLQSRQLQFEMLTDETTGVN